MFNDLDMKNTMYLSLDLNQMQVRMKTKMKNSVFIKKIEILNSCVG